METLGMACLFDSCEKEIQQNLEKYKKCEAILLQLLHAIHQAKLLPPAENPEELLKYIVNKVICSRDEGEVPAYLPDTENFEEGSVSVADILDQDDDGNDREDDDNEDKKCAGPNWDENKPTQLPVDNVNENKEGNEAVCSPIDNVVAGSEVTQEETTEDITNVSITVEHASIEVIDDDVKESDPPNLFSTADNSLENEDISVLCLGGPKVGVKYEMEVTSSLYHDGTFWASHVDNANIKDKLEHLSDLLRASTKADRSLWKVDRLDEMVCLKSSENGLWMRAVVIKEINDGAVKLLFIDVGSSEECQRSRLSKVPKPLADIPYMAFYCALFEEPVKIPYEGIWRFSDICKKQILNFTCEKFIERNNKRLLLGKIETILDEPVINVTDDIRDYLKPIHADSGQQEGDSIVSRDIRTKEANNITSVTEIIRSDILHGSNSSLSSAVSGSDQTNQKKIKLPPVLIPSPDESCYSSSDKLSWADVKTPTADDLDEIFNETVQFTPEETDSHGQGISKFNFDVNSNETPTAEKSPEILQDNSCKQLAYNSNKDNTESTPLSMSVEHVDNLLHIQQKQDPHSSISSSELPITQMSQSEETDQQNIMARYQLMQLQYEYLRMIECGNIQNPNVNIVQESILNLNQQTYGSASSTMPFVQNLQPAQIPPQGVSECYETTNHPPFNYQNLHDPVSVELLHCVSTPGSPGCTISENGGHPNLLGKKDGSFSSCQHDTYFNILDHYPQENLTQYASNPNPHTMQQQSGFAERNLYNLHEQSLHAHPHLDHNVLNHFTCDSGCTSDKGNRKGTSSSSIAIENSNLSTRDGVFRKDILNPHDTEVSTSKYNIESVHHGSKTECVNKSAQHKKSTTSSIEPNYAMGPRFMAKKNTRKKVGEYERDSNKSNFNKMHVSSNKSPPLHHDKFNNTYSNRNSYGEDRFSNRSIAGEELKKFEEVSLEKMITETRNDWVAREIYNLTHPYFEHKKARFFTVRVKEFTRGWYGPVLERALRYKSYYLREPDLDIFRNEWDRNDGPLFLFVKHEPFNAEDWKTGGIFQVITKIKQLPEINYLGKMGCQVKFVSTAMVEHGPAYKAGCLIRSDKNTREIQPELARAYIRFLITQLQDGACENLFLLPQYQRSTIRDGKCNQPNTNEKVIDQSMNSQYKKSGLAGEDWDRALEEIKGFSKNEFGSDDDEYDERDLNLEMDVYGLNQEDI